MDSGPAPWSLPRTLPGRDYHDGDVFDHERERIFEAGWYCVGRAEEVAAPGAFTTVDVGRESVIVVRGEEGELRGFFNSCRHRGSRICEGAGSVRRALKCPYHAWSYGLDGRLLGTPNVTTEALQRDELGLVPVRLTTFDGFIWVALTDEPGPLLEYLPLHASDDPFAWERYGVAELVVGAVRTYDVMANWKLIVENYNECLHCPTVHPELVQVVPLYRTGDVIEEEGWNGNRLAPGLHSFTPSGESGLPSLPGLEPRDTDAFYGITLLPNLIVNYHTDCVSTFLLQPVAPNHTRVTCHYLFRPETVAADDFDPSPVVDFRHLLATQDWAVCEGAQKGMDSRAFVNGGVLPFADRYVHDFHRRYLELRGATP